MNMDRALKERIIGAIVLVLIVGVLATRRAGGSPEDYFLAGRRLGTVVLFMALFGTNATYGAWP